MPLVRKFAVRSAVVLSLAGLGFYGLGASVAGAATTAQQSAVHAAVHAAPLGTWEYSGESFDTEQECIDVGEAAVSDSGGGFEAFACPSDGPTWDLWLEVADECGGTQQLQAARPDTTC
jgi:hypothetical protein